MLAISAPTLLKPREAAAILRTTEGTLKNWRHRRQGPPFHRVGHSIRYEQEQLESWIGCPTSENRNDGGYIGEPFLKSIDEGTI